MLEFDDEAQGPGRPVIKVIGVGGGGGNSVNTMIEAGVEGVDFICANTDCQVLEASMAGTKVHLGRNLTKGLGAGANPEIGRAAALEDAQRVAETLTGADMVFVTAGMGGGTGTGAAPVIAQVARDLGALTVGVVTKPFAFEGSQRKKKASAGINELAKAVDALIVIPNDRLVSLAGMKMTLKDAFGMVDNVCLNAVRGISDLVIAPGLINVDFADVRTIMTGMGRALMGTGYGTGDKRAIEAAQQAISSPLLEDVSINGATGILLNITGGPGPDAGRDERGVQPDRGGRRSGGQHHLRVGHRRARGRPGPHHRHRDRLQRARAGAPDAGRGAAAMRAGREGQMALPMQSSGMAQAPTMMMPQQPQPSMSPWGQTSNPTTRGGYAVRPGAAARRQRRDHQPRRVLLEHVARFRRRRWARSPRPRSRTAPEWTPSERPERPIRCARRPRLRLHAPAGRRQMQSPAPG